MPEFDNTSGVAYLYREDQEAIANMDMMALAQRDYVARGQHLQLEYDPYHLPVDLVVDEEYHDRAYERRRAENVVLHRRLDRIGMTKKQIERLEKDDRNRMARLKREATAETRRKRQEQWKVWNERAERQKKEREDEKLRIELLEAKQARVGRYLVDNSIRDSVWFLDIQAGDYRDWCSALRRRIRAQKDVINGVYKAPWSNKTRLTFVDLPSEDTMIEYILMLEQQFEVIQAHLYFRRIDDHDDIQYMFIDEKNVPR